MSFERLKEVNSITYNVFGTIFYSANDGWIDLIKLHDLFINFMHRKNEVSSEKIEVFFNELKKNNQTEHFPDIIRWALLA